MQRRGATAGLRQCYMLCPNFKTAHMDLRINTFGTRIRCSRERIVLAVPGNKAKYKMQKEYPVRALEKIIILRPSSISTGAVQLALEAGVNIVYLNSFGTPVGRIFSSSPKGIADLRKAQVVFSSSPKALELSRRLVAAKGTNQVAHLRQLARKYRASFTREIVQCETMIDSLNLLDRDIQLAASYSARRATLPTNILRA